MSVIPCSQNKELREKIDEFAELLRREAHTLGPAELSNAEMHASGVFRGAIERLRGQFSASMKDKRQFAAAALDRMAEGEYIKSWSSAGEKNRHDYLVELNSERLAAIELKGCLDGNNTNIFERPPQAHEFIIWSICTNPGADPRHNAWSGIHTRLGAEMIDRQQQIDGLIVWDMVCGTIGRPCPKLTSEGVKTNDFGEFHVPPPCIYRFPSTIPSPRNNAAPKAHGLPDVELLSAFADCFGEPAKSTNAVTFTVGYDGVEIVRTTRIMRDDSTVEESKPTPIRRR